MSSSFVPDTERSSAYDHLEAMDTQELLGYINREDQTVAEAVGRELDAIAVLVDAVHERMAAGGRLFYLGAGTSGRLGILDASECPPTFGVPHGWVNGIIAGGDQAIRKAVEFAEDDPERGWQDLLAEKISPGDVLVGIAASGRTPYVVGAVNQARAAGILTGCITCSTNSPLEAAAAYPIVVKTGPELVTGSTRMKAGTAQKLVLNMLSTSVMIKLGRIKGNRMVDMQLANAKLLDRGARMIQEALGIPYEAAAERLSQFGSVRKAIEAGA